MIASPHEDGKYKSKRRLATFLVKKLFKNALLIREHLCDIITGVKKNLHNDVTTADSRIPVPVPVLTNPQINGTFSKPIYTQTSYVIIYIDV